MYNLPALNTNITKTELSIIAESTINEVLNNKNPIEVIDVISKMEYLIKEIRSNKDFIEFIRGYISLEGKEVTTSSGSKIELAEVGVKYDYSNCGDLMLNELNEQKETIEAAIKERQIFLRSIPIEGMDIVTIHGELVKIYPPSKSSTSSFKVTIKK